MLEVVKVNFGGEIGSRPAIILNRRYEKAQVLKVTTKSRNLYKDKIYRLSGYSGVHGYICLDSIYEIPMSMIEKQTAKLFKFEEEQALNQLLHLKSKGKVRTIDLSKVV